MSSTDTRKLLVIVGITGNQGSSIANLFSKPPLSNTWRLRGITRDTSKPSNKPLLDAGIELVSANLDDPSSLKYAFQGADAIFAVTDFWQFVKAGHETFAEAEKRGVEPNVVAMEKEIRQGKNIVDAAAAVHTQNPLHRLVISTLSDSKKWSKGEITHNLHFDGKAKYVDYLETTYPSLAKVTSYVQVGFYLSNAFAFPFWIPQPDPKNPKEYIVPHGGRGEAPIPFVNASQDTGYFVEALINRMPPETEMLGYCNLISFDEYASLWGKVLGVKARAEYFPKEKLTEAGLPEWMALEVGESGQYVSKYGWAGDDPSVKTPEECGVDMSKLTDVGEWIRRQEWKL